jgi:capsular exopolysaccharide synthesis family protein
MFDFRGYLRALRRWKWLILTFAIVCAATSALVSLQLQKTYASTATALVSPRQVLSNPTQADQGQLPTIDQLMNTYSGLIDSDPVRQRLAAGGVPRSAGELRGHIVATRIPDTTLIKITAQDRDPAVALLISQNVVAAFNASLEELQAKTPGNAQNSKLDALVSWETPTARPGLPISPDIPTNTALGLGAGLVVAIALAVLLERLDTTIKVDTDVALKLDVPLLGAVFYRRTRRGHDPDDEMEVITSTHSKDPVAEQYRGIRTNVLFSRIDQSLGAIVVTSTLPGEGKTTTSSNLAVVMAQAGFSVILVDGDFRRPSLHKVFGIQRNRGLGNLILANNTEAEVLIETNVPNLRLLCSGPTPPNPSELLGSTAMDRVMRRLKELSDVLIIDTPPIGAVTDATVLGANADGVILVVERGRTPVEAIKRSLETLRKVGIDPMGVVLNKAMATDPYYSYSYYYGEDPKPPKEKLSVPVAGREEPASRTIAPRPEP